MTWLLGALRGSFWFVCTSEAPLQPDSMLRHVTRRASEVLADLEEHGAHCTRAVLAYIICTDEEAWAVSSRASLNQSGMPSHGHVCSTLQPAEPGNNDESLSIVKREVIVSHFACGYAVEF